MSAPQVSSKGTMIAAAMAVIIALGAGAFAFHERTIAQQASAQNVQILESLRTTNAQVEQLTAKLNELSAPKPTPVAVLPSRTSHGRRYPASQRRVDDPRWNKFQSQMDEQGRALDSTRAEIASTRQDVASTRQDLMAAKGELGDSIARTHGELVALQRKGERSYYEFSIDKAKTFKPLGPMAIRLKKADQKHQFADLELVIDDRVVSKKHVNLFEPAMFYTSDSDQPAQVVINSVTKNHIRGYVSEAKYRPGQLSAMAQGAEQPQRQKLPAPK